MAKSVKYWRNKCDARWREIIRKPARCAICGKSAGQLHVHHLISRSAVFFRHNINNGILLCPTCHNFGFGQGNDEKISAHGTPWAFEDWMKEHRPDQYAWWVKNRHQVITGVTIDYEAVYEQLGADDAK